MCGNALNTNLEGEHPNRKVIFIDNALLLPIEEGKNPDEAYYLGYKLSKSIQEQLEIFNATLVHLTVPDPFGLDIVEYARDNQIPLMGTYHSNLQEYFAHYGLPFLKPILEPFLCHVYNFLQDLNVPTPYIWYRTF